MTVREAESILLLWGKKHVSVPDLFLVLASSLCQWMMPALDWVDQGSKEGYGARMGVARVCHVKAAGWNLQRASTCSFKTREETIGPVKAMGPRVLVCPGGDIGSSQKQD